MRDDFFGDDFHGAHARPTDPITSHEAAESLTPEQIRRSEEAVYRVLREYGPCDDKDLIKAYYRAVAAGFEHFQEESGIRTRRSDLAKKHGLVVDTGERIVRGRGRRAIIWAVAS